MEWDVGCEEPRRREQFQVRDLVVDVQMVLDEGDAFVGAEGCQVKTRVVVRGASVDRGKEKGFEPCSAGFREGCEENIGRLGSKQELGNHCDFP